MRIPSPCRAACVGILFCLGFIGSDARAGDAAISAEERSRIKAEILELERQFDESYRSNDLDRYWAFYADDVTQLWDTGRVRLDEYKKQWTALVEAGGGVVDSRAEDLRVSVGPSGDTAVATYQVWARYRDADGNETAARYNETDVWFRRDGRWQIAHYHFSKAAEEPADTAAGSD